MLYGNELLAACVRPGVDYFDLCGEPIWMRQKIEQHEAAAKHSGSRIVFSCGYDSLPFELGVFCAQEEAKKGVRCAGGARQGPPSENVGHAVRRHGGEHARHRGGDDEGFEPGLDVAGPFVLTPGFDGPKQPLGNRPKFDDELQTWTRPL